VSQRGPDTFGKNERKLFEINVRHFTRRLHNGSSQTRQVSLLNRRLRGGLVNYRGAFQNFSGSQTIRATVQLTQIQTMQCTGHTEREAVLFRSTADWR
jgi:hypothetical protein